MNKQEETATNDWWKRKHSTGSKSCGCKADTKVVETCTFIVMCTWITVCI